MCFKLFILNDAGYVVLYSTFCLFYCCFNFLFRVIQLKKIALLMSYLVLSWKKLPHLL